MNMNFRIPILLVLFCMIAVPFVSAAGDYLGGDIVLGGSGPKQITQITTPVVATTATTGSISVTTSPAGATIIIDGVQQGISPATIPGLSAGSHILLLKKEGYKDLAKSVTIIAGQTLTYSTEFSQAAGSAVPAATSAPASAAAVPTPAQPQKKTPGFEAACGLAALGAVLVIRKSTR